MYRDLLMKIQLVQPDAKGYCGPLAIAAVAGEPVARVLKKCLPLKANPNSNCWGMSGGALLTALEKPVKQHIDPRVRTPVTAARYLPKKGKFLCFTRDHVFAVVDGSVVDWTEGRRHRITYVTEVIEQ